MFRSAAISCFAFKFDRRVTGSLFNSIDIEHLKTWLLQCLSLCSEHKWPGWYQANIWNDARILLIGPWRTNCNEIVIKIQQFSFTKMRLKMPEYIRILLVILCWVCVDYFASVKLDFLCYPMTHSSSYFSYSYHLQTKPQQSFAFKSSSMGCCVYDCGSPTNLTPFGQLTPYIDIKLGHYCPRWCFGPDGTKSLPELLLINNQWH